MTRPEKLPPPSTIVGVYMHAVTRKAQPWPLDVRELDYAWFRHIKKMSCPLIRAETRVTKGALA